MKEPRGGWTDERVEELRKLFWEGFSASQIASRLGGITRNSVIGKLNRLGLKRGHSNLSRSAHKKVERKRRERPQRKPGRRTVKLSPLFDLLCEPLPEEPADDIATTTVLERQPNQCGWPIGEPAEMKCCGAEVVPHLPYGSPYCRKHAQRAFALPTVSRGGFVLQDMKDANARKYARAAGEILEKEKEAA